MAEKKPDRKKNIAGRVREAVEELIVQAGYSVWDVTYYKEAAEPILEISIDREGGISTDDCLLVTKLIDPVIDALDPIEDSYCMEVSSAGSVRELRLPAHEAYAMEHRFPVTVRTFAAIDGKKQFEGILVGTTEDTILLSVPDSEQALTIERKQIAKMSAECAEL